MALDIKVLSEGDKEIKLRESSEIEEPTDFRDIADIDRDKAFARRVGREERTPLPILRDDQEPEAPKGFVLGDILLEEEDSEEELWDMPAEDVQEEKAEDMLGDDFAEEDEAQEKMIEE